MAATADNGVAAEHVEVITDPTRVKENPILTIRTAETEGKKFFFRISQPKGRALLIALHL
jgi:hypothetical protein